MLGVQLSEVTAVPELLLSNWENSNAKDMKA